MNLHLPISLIYPPSVWMAVIKLRPSVTQNIELQPSYNSYNPQQQLALLVMKPAIARLVNVIRSFKTVFIVQQIKKKMASQKIQFSFIYFSG